MFGMWVNMNVIYFSTAVIKFEAVFTPPDCEDYMREYAAED